MSMFDAVTQIHYARIRGGGYTAVQIKPSVKDLGLVRRNLEGKWVATSFSKGVKVGFKNREEAGRWLTT